MEGIVQLLNEMEERRQKEREEDKKERKAVAEEIKEGVRKEMTEVMKPWQERTVRVEERATEMGEDMKTLKEEMKELRKQLATSQGKQNYASVTSSGRASPEFRTEANMVPINNTDALKDREEKERICSLLSSAKRVVGLKPIDKRHVEQFKRRLEEVEGETEVEKEERAKRGAVMLFLKHEMKMKEEDIEELEIVKIFPPAREDWNVLYVELATWEMAQLTRSFTTFMRRGTTGEDRVELINYIPRDLFNRYKAINAIGNQARLESNKTTTFRVSFGVDDFILQQKLRGSMLAGAGARHSSCLLTCLHSSTTCSAAQCPQERLQDARLLPLSRPGRGTGKCPCPRATLRPSRRPLSSSWTQPTW